MDSFIIKTPPIPQVKCQSAFGSVGKMLLELLLRTFQVDRREEEKERGGGGEEDNTTTTTTRRASSTVFFC
jgi:hypothetical protein